MAAILDTGALLEVIWVSLVAGVGVTVVYSVALLGGTRFSEARRDGRSGAATLFGALAVVASLAFAFGVGYAVHLVLAG